MSWTLERAEDHLLSLERSGMNFGLERVRRLLAALGDPQKRLRAIHVVGTNGKSSTVRMTAALLEAHGVHTGAYLSPHLTAFTERIRIGDEEIAADAFGAALERAAATGIDGVTQFELLTAAALDELARREVEVAVVEAGLGGRHDATNVLDAAVAVLTNVELDHTRWLGTTVREIAGEKLGVVRPHATLVLGQVDAEVEALAAATGARIVRAEPLDVPLRGYQRANFLVAAAAARAVTGRLDAATAADVAARVRIPGRLEQVGESPVTIVDGAHNPSGMEALTADLPGVTGDRRLVGVVSVLDDKDAEGMLRVLMGNCAAVVFTASRNPRSLAPEALAAVSARLGGPPYELADDPHAALERARELAGPDGAVVATGSLYLVADLAGARKVSVL